MFGDSGDDSYRPGYLIERFTRAAPENFGPNRLIKTVAKSDDIIDPHVHTHKLRDRALFINTDNVPLKHFPSARQDVVTHSRAQINHYFTKTAEEWALKRSRGKADYPIGHKDRIRDDAEFKANNRNDEEDTTILRWKDAMILCKRKIFHTHGE
jgi:hypothetical protein